MPAEVIVALIGAAATTLGLILKHQQELQAQQLTEMRADVNSLTSIVAPVVDWAFTLERHISDGLPPPPPARPPALNEFFAAAFVGLNRTEEPLPVRRGFLAFIKKGRTA